MKALLLIFILSISCGKIPERKSSEVPQNVTSLYSSGELKVKVYYEPGAEPYTDKVQGVELWNLLKVNLEALFQGRQTTVSVPKTLSEMVKTKDFNKASWTIEEVLQMAAEHPLLDSPGTQEFQIFFLQGLADNNPRIIGYHISNTKIMAIFKDVIKASGGGSLDPAGRYMEQATLVHEMGHALGLVNNGLPMVKNHQDTAHGAHCSNPDCVMYYSNEGASNMVNFARNTYNKGEVIMYDPACLEDARNFKK